MVITPGRTILEKTTRQLHAGHPKSLLGPMSFRPVVITAENFATPAMRAAMDDETQVKMYLFTVQSLLKPSRKRAARPTSSRRAWEPSSTPTCRDGRGLVVFADEHHCYYAPAFSAAVRDLDPWVLVGLTATPAKADARGRDHLPLPARGGHRRQAREDAGHRRAGVMTGRTLTTKLTDGVTLLKAKKEALDAYAQGARD